MVDTVQDRAQYLSLALFAQKVVSALIDYVDENRTGALKPSLSEALESLRSVRNSSTSGHRRLAAFRTYEHLRTLDEVWSSKDRTQAIHMIRSVLQASPKSPKPKAAAERLISLFSKLQEQALANYEQPKPVSPKIMQRLCQSA